MKYMFSDKIQDIQIWISNNQNNFLIEIRVTEHETSHLKVYISMAVVCYAVLQLNLNQVLNIFITLQDNLMPTPPSSQPLGTINLLSILMEVIHSWYVIYYITWHLLFLNLSPMLFKIHSLCSMYLYFNFLLWMKNIPLHTYTTIHVFTYPIKNIYTISHFHLWL